MTMSVRSSVSAADLQIVSCDDHCSVKINFMRTKQPAYTVEAEGEGLDQVKLVTSPLVIFY